MRIAVTGGSEYADLFTGILTEKKNRVTVIEEDRGFCERLSASYDADVVCGDPCRESILQEAGIRDYDVIAALGQEDADNLEICQMAKKVLGVKKAICLVRNPRNVELFEKLGVDRAVNIPRILEEFI